MLAVPYSAVADVAREIAPVAAGKIVIDPTNPLKADGSGLATDPGTSGAETLAAPPAGRQGRQGVQHAVRDQHGQPGGPRHQLDSLFATDDEAAKDAVCGLSRSIGFRPVHVGPLAASRELEAMAWLNIRLQMLTGGSWNTAFVMVDPPGGGPHLRPERTASASPAAQRTLAAAVAPP